MDTAINEFFETRKEAWLSTKIKASMSEAEIAEMISTCEHTFDLSQWLPNAAKRAGQISISTHPCTFSHPSARKNKNGYVSSIIYKAERRADGFLRTGNVEVNADALGNAAALDVYKFLMLIMMDGETLLAHIEKDTQLAKQLLDIKTSDYSSLKQGFLAIEAGSSETVSSSKIKQVYFPIEHDEYHQLSLLSNSGIMYELRKRIDSSRFSDEAKHQRALKKKNTLSEQGYSEIYNLTTIGYGGTKPQNISVLNNKNGGKVHLLNSLPPNIDIRKVRFPRRDFFTDTLYFKDYAENFKSLHSIFSDARKNINIIRRRDNLLDEVIGRIIKEMWLQRSVVADQYYPDTSSLEKYQRIWLCENEETRLASDDWLDTLINEIARWILVNYKKQLKSKAIDIEANEELVFFIKRIEIHKEALR